MFLFALPFIKFTGVRGERGEEGKKQGYKAIKAWCAMDSFFGCNQERKHGEKKEPPANQGNASLVSSANCRSADPDPHFPWLAKWAIGMHADGDNRHVC
jgi:hypothetical protein